MDCDNAIDRNNILEECLNKKGLVSEKRFKKAFPQAYAELQGIDFPDNFSFKQKLYHYLHNDDNMKLGVCPVCGGRCNLKSFRDGYHRYCKNSCAQLDSETRNKIKQTCIERYGDECYSRTNAWKESVSETWNKKDVSEITRKRNATKLERYGDACYNNREQISMSLNGKTDTEKMLIVEKRRKTNEERYGGTSIISDKIKESWSNIPKEKIDERTEKTKRTKYERYGKSTYNNRDASRNTCLERYGVENVSQSDFVKNNVRNTCLERYGVENVSQDKNIAEKARETRKANEVGKRDFLIGYTDDGLWICKCENSSCNKCKERTYTITAANYDDRKRVGSETCTILNPVCVQTSGCENELLEYIKSVYNGEVISSDRSVLGGKELDIYIPKLRLAFEYNGVYWHSDLYKDKTYHSEKTQKCLELGIQLIHIWEDEWIYKNDIVKDTILNKLGSNKKTIDARKCEVLEISAKTAKPFCEMYHIQGYTASTTRFGLYHNDELVMVAVFGQVRRISGAGKKDGEWELYRLCSPFGTVVRGGAGKLLSAFVRKYEPKCVVTFADLDKSNGNVYEKIGFEKSYIVPPTYYWCIGNRRYPRYRFQKSNLEECKENPNLTEDEVMRTRGYFKCWDSGKIKYVWQQKQ